MIQRVAFYGSIWIVAAWLWYTVIQTVTAWLQSAM